jgi:hypothetical protein
MNKMDTPTRKRTKKNALNRFALLSEMTAIYNPSEASAPKEVEMKADCGFALVKKLMPCQE